MATSLSSLYCGQPSHALGLAAVLLTMDFIINTDLYNFFLPFPNHNKMGLESGEKDNTKQMNELLLRAICNQ